MESESHWNALGLNNNSYRTLLRTAAEIKSLGVMNMDHGALCMGERLYACV